MAVKVTEESFISRSVAIHGGKYGYSKVKYIGYKSPVTVICPHHGEFIITPVVHLSAKHGCHKCTSTHRLTTAESVANARKVHGDTYDYSNDNYINACTKVDIVCAKHGVFSVAPTNQIIQL